MKTIVVTGLAGFVGSHLTDLLLEDPDVRVVGIIHPTHQVQHLEDHPRVTVYRKDIVQAEPLMQLIATIRPEVVYHLAGMAHVHESWKNRKETLEVNFVGTFNLIEACRALPVFPKLLLVGSGECYGNVPESEQPIRESRGLSPSSPYAVSKIAQEMLGIECAKFEKLPVYLTRSFNHTGPRQRETFVCSAFAYQIALAERAGDPTAVMRVGNMAPRRDFSDARDVVRAYKAILDHGTPGEPYNVCSGAAHSIEEILRMLIQNSRCRFEVTVDPDKFRPVDVPLVHGDPSKLRLETGWKPEYDLPTTLSDLLDYWRRMLP